VCTANVQTVATACDNNVGETTYIAANELEIAGELDSGTIFVTSRVKHFVCGTLKTPCRLRSLHRSNVSTSICMDTASYSLITIKVLTVPAGNCLSVSRGCILSYIATIFLAP
jgi:hypothetical protein